MAKLTRAQAKQHEQAEALLKQDTLKPSERDFVLENWHPNASKRSGAAMFFTPMELAGELAIYRCETNGVVVDIGAGIGRLTRMCIDYSHFDQAHPQYICIEQDADNVRVGKKCVPEAEWIHGDALDPEVWEHIEKTYGKVDYVISNPPFGNIKGHSDAHLAAVGIALDHAKYGGVFILPQNDLPYKYSGPGGYQRLEPGQYSAALRRFLKAYPDANFLCTAIDCEVYEDGWDDASPKVELMRVQRGPE